MRKLYFFLLLSLTCGMGYSQVNYTFTASTGTFSQIAGGTTATLTAATTPAQGIGATDEGFMNGVPIGFTFLYNGTPFTTVNLNSNGFMGFGTGFTTDDNEDYFLNNLTSGPFLPASRPLIAPLWDDHDVAQINFITTGSAPNRVFTVEWLNVKWRYNASAPSISFQAKLYETTNVIEFVYRQEAGTVGANPTASIGITASGTGSGNFMSLSGSGSSPTASSAAETSNITTRPATGQLYTFTPLSCGLPSNLRLISLTSSSAGFEWNMASGASAYEFAVTTSSTPPASGTSIGTTAGSQASLTASTQYYLHVRSNCSGTFSPFVTIAFSTPCAATTTGYFQSFDAVTTPALPPCVRVQDVNADGFTWVTGTANPPNIPSINIRYRWNENSAADDWFFIGPFSLVTGTNYTVNFKYKASDGPTFVERMEVKYGTSPLAVAMTSPAIFSNSNINTALANPYTDGTGNFSVTSDGDYYIGFRVFSLADQGVLHLDDVQLVGGTFPVSLTSLRGEKSGDANILSWKTLSETNNRGFELERSADGKSFSQITFVATKGDNGNSNTSLSYTYTDEKPLSGTNYYRLKQVDRDGKYSYSDIVTLKNRVTDFKISSLYPNPAKAEVKMVITATNAGKATVVVTDLTGKVISQIPTQLMVGDNIQQIKVQSLATGTYMVKVIAESGLETAVQRFIKN